MGDDVHRITPRLQQLLLAGFHFVHHGPEIIHDQLTPVGADDLQGGLGTRLPPELDRLVQFGELGVGEFPGPLEALLLGGIVPGEGEQRVELPRDPAGSRGVGFQIPSLAGQEKPTLTRLGILEQRHEPFEALQNLVGMHDPPICL